MNNMNIISLHSNPVAITLICLNVCVCVCVSLYSFSINDNILHNYLATPIFISFLLDKRSRQSRSG